MIIGGDVCKAKRISTRDGLHPDFEIAVSAPVRSVSHQLAVRRERRLRRQPGVGGEPFEDKLAGERRIFAEVAKGNYGSGDQDSNGGNCQRCVRRPSRGPRRALECRGVGAFRQVDADGVAAPIGLIVFLQPRSEAARVRLL